MGFNKQKLLHLMANPSILNENEKEVEELQSVVTEYPYFQLGHTLIAKAKHDLQAPDAYEALSHAAIYAPSRRLLRKIFYENLRIDLPDAFAPAEDQENVPAVEESQESPAPAPEERSEESQAPLAEVPEIHGPSSQTEAPTAQPEEANFHTEEPIPDKQEEQETSTDDSDAVHRELEENLQNLRAAREQSMKEEKEKEGKDGEENDKKKTTFDAEPPALQKPEEPASENQGPSSTGNAPYLLDYLKDIEPLQSERLGIHQKHQIELIDKFMTSERDVRIRWRSPEHPAEDLSEKNTATPDNFVTENLAGIYIKQGKKDKAIQIYEKLSLKYPEKKTYFAEKIESIKEK